jgi:hypothetical protein
LDASTKRPYGLLPGASVSTVMQPAHADDPLELELEAEVVAAPPAPPAPPVPLLDAPVLDELLAVLLAVVLLVAVLLLVVLVPLPDEHAVEVARVQTPAARATSAVRFVAPRSRTVLDGCVPAAPGAIGVGGAIRPRYAGGFRWQDATLPPLRGAYQANTEAAGVRRSLVPSVRRAPEWAVRAFADGGS